MPGDYLSPEGRRRQEQILQMALRDVRRRRVLRLATPSAAAAVVILALAVSLHWNKPVANNKQVQLAAKSMPAPIPFAEPRQALPSTIAEQIPPAVTYVLTDPTLADRLTLKPVEPRWTAVDDDQFVKALADAGKPMGIAYVNGKAILLGSAEAPDVHPGLR